MKYDTIIDQIEEGVNSIIKESIRLSLNNVPTDYMGLYLMMREYFLTHQDVECPDEIKEALDL